MVLRGCHQVTRCVFIAYVSSKATEYVQSVIPSPVRLVEAAMALVKSGLLGRDLANGEAMYSATGCVTCHRLGGEGGTVGPDLTRGGQRFNLQDILEAVIDPSRTISDQYRMMLLKTSDGQTHSGRIVPRDDESTRISPNLMRPSQTVAVNNKLIMSERALPVSIMPSGLVNTH